MCGFVFYKNVVKSSSDTEYSTLLMLKQILHRGPDGSHTLINEQLNYGLGHNRLAILDLDVRSDQPFKSLCERYAIVFNGEIYNFKALRTELELNYGVTFRTSGDTEVLLMGYIKEGVQFFDKLDGMFAAIIYDNLKNKFSIVRDFNGVKPLYIYNKNGLFLAASELRSIAKIVPEKSLDKIAISSFLIDGFISGLRSPFLNINKMEAGTCLVFDGNTLELELKYSINPNPTDENFDFEKSIIEGVKSRFVADVPVGIFLSGGVDSSLVTAVAKKVLNQNPICFTLGLKDDSRDESIRAAKIASDLNLDHKCLLVSEKDIEEKISTIFDVYDEPFGDISAVLTILLSEFASKHVKVVLSADGGDELFLGYKRQTLFNTNFVKLLLRMPPLARKLTIKLLRIAGYFRKSLSYKINKVIGFLYAPSQQESYRHLNGTFNLNDLMLEPDKLDKQIHPFLTDFKNYMPNDIFQKVDRATMAYSIEGREPLMHKLIYKQSNIYKRNFSATNNKKCLLEMLLKIYPNYSVMKKSGFSFSLTNCNSFIYAKDAIDWEWISNLDIINNEEVKRLEEQYILKDLSNVQKLYFLFVLTSWKEKWL